MHVAAGGTMPSVARLAVPVLLAFAVSAQLAGGTSRWRLAAAVALSQVAFHTLFLWGSGASVAIAPGQGAHAGHDPRALALDAASGAHAAHIHLTGPMAAAHALAALGTYAVLRHADLLLESGRRWARSLLARLRLPTPWRPAPIGIGTPFAGSTPRQPRIVALPRGVRGPPLSLA